MASDAKRESTIIQIYLRECLIKVQVYLVNFISKRNIEVYPLLVDGLKVQYLLQSGFK